MHSNEALDAIAPAPVVPLADDRERRRPNVGQDHRAAARHCRSAPFRPIISGPCRRSILPTTSMPRRVGEPDGRLLLRHWPAPMSWEAPVRFRVSVVVATLLLTGCNANLSSRNGPRGRRRPQLSGLQSLQSHQLSTEQQPSGRCDNPAPPVSELAAGDGPAHRHGGRGRRRPHGATRRRVWVRNGPPSINARRLHSLTQDLIFGNEPELSSAPASDEKGNREIWLEAGVAPVWWTGWGLGVLA
jgi:hypothetical protein